MIPVGNSEKINRFPWMNLLILLLNWGVFAYVFFFSGAPQHVIVKYGFIPAAFFKHHSSLLSALPIWLTLITANFLHGGLLHILGNSLFLWVFGGSIEDRLGKFRYLLFFLVLGAISMIVQGYAQKGSTLVVIGASGAIAGVMGAFYILFPRAKISTSFIFFIKDIPALYYLFFWFLLNLLRGFLHLEGKDVEPVAWWAHVGGFLAGAVLVNLFMPWHGHSSSGEEKAQGKKGKKSK